MNKIEEIKKPYTPVDMGNVNGQMLKLALFDGEFPWHKHDDCEELFFVYKGEIEIQLRDKTNIRMKEGEIFVVPKGVEHAAKSVIPSYVLFLRASD